MDDKTGALLSMINIFRIRYGINNNDSTDKLGNSYPLINHELPTYKMWDNKSLDKHHSDSTRVYVWIANMDDEDDVVGRLRSFKKVKELDVWIQYGISNRLIETIGNLDLEAITMWISVAEPYARDIYRRLTEKFNNPSWLPNLKHCVLIVYLDGAEEILINRAKYLTTIGIISWGMINIGSISKLINAGARHIFINTTKLGHRSRYNKYLPNDTIKSFHVKIRRDVDDTTVSCLGNLIGSCKGLIHLGLNLGNYNKNVLRLGKRIKMLKDLRYLILNDISEVPKSTIPTLEGLSLLGDHWGYCSDDINLKASYKDIIDDVISVLTLNPYLAMFSLCYACRIPSDKNEIRLSRKLKRVIKGNVKRANRILKINNLTGTYLELLDYYTIQHINSFIRSPPLPIADRYFNPQSSDELNHDNSKIYIDNVSDGHSIAFDI